MLPLFSPFANTNYTLSRDLTNSTSAESDENAASQNDEAARSEPKPRRASGLRMEFLIDRFQVLLNDLRVNLCRGNVAVAEHLLNGFEIRAVFQQMRRKAVPEGVRRNVLLNPGGLLIVLDDLPEALAGHTLTAEIHEQSLLKRIGNHAGPNLVDVLLQSANRCGIERDHPALGPGAAPNQSGGQIGVLQVKRDQLADANAGGVEQLQHSLVAEALGVGEPGLFQQGLDLLAREDLRQLLLNLCQMDGLRRVDRNHVNRNQIGEKALDGRKAAGDRGGGFAAVRHPGEVEGKLIGRDLLDRDLPSNGDVLIQLPDIPKVGGHCIGRSLFFVEEIALVHGDAVNHTQSFFLNQKIKSAAKAASSSDARFHARSRQMGGWASSRRQTPV